MKHFCERPRVYAVLAALLLAGLGAPGAQGQERTRSGFWLEAGAGTGGVWLGCSLCEEPAASYGESSYLRGGGAFSERVLWGLEVFTLLSGTFNAAEDDVALEAENVSIAPVVLWYPWRGGVFAKGGVGLSFGEVRVPVEDKETVRAGGTGAGMTFGAGFDVPILSWLALTTNFGVYYGTIGDVTVRDVYVDDVITTVYNVNFALTLR